MPVERALVSVSDKSGLEEFAGGLSRLGVEIFSTGGTRAGLASSGVRVRGVEELTGVGELLDGRVKTLHPGVCAGILANRSDPSHVEQLASAGFRTIDLVVVNLYPFRDVAAKRSSTIGELLENVDIGGITLVRAAAKNCDHVGVVCNPARYPLILEELAENGLTLSEETRRSLALEAFGASCAYDGMIRRTLSERFGIGDVPGETLDLHYESHMELRYGENPYQKARFYRDPLFRAPSVSTAKVLGGKQLSYNNILDMNSALDIVMEFSSPAAAVVKHNNPCGVAVADGIAEAFRTALDADRMSAYGGIVALNRQCDLPTARVMKGHFFECVIAPGYDDNALEWFASGKKNLRVCSVDGAVGPGGEGGFTFSSVRGGMLAQSTDFPGLDVDSLKVVTKRAPTGEQLVSMGFGVRVCRHIKSNTILLVKGNRTVGIGAGQMSRVDAAMLASYKAGEEAEGCVLVSDAFFPFRDGVDEAARSGVAAIVQPGGSIRDDEVIAAADEHDIAMVFSGVRLFRH